MGAHGTLTVLLWLMSTGEVTHAQNRGVYPLGLSAINSGVTPGPGFTYNNSFLLYARDEQKGGAGQIVASGQQSVLLDMNTLVWVSSGQIEALGNATFSSALTIPIANNSLSSSIRGPISGGEGFGDVYLQPVILGWRKEWVDVRGILGVLAPTGRFSAGATDNVGNGYWTPVLASGETFYLSADRTMTVSLFDMYEFHSTQYGTDIRPGETFDLDYSVMKSLALPFEDARLQVGLVGYEAWQTTAKIGPNMTPAEEAQRYRVNGIGAGLNLTLPTQKVTLAFKFFHEFANQFTYQGYSLQVSAGIGF
jgi:hypothetical protein